MEIVVIFYDFSVIKLRPRDRAAGRVALWGQNAHFLSRKPARTTRVAVNEAHGVTRIHAFHQPAATVDSKARGGTRHGVISHPQRARQ